MVLFFLATAVIAYLNTNALYADAEAVTKTHTVLRALRDIASLAKDAETPRFQPDIVFLDIGLPGMNGYDVAQQMRAEATFGNPTLVALTGWGSKEDRRRSSEAGFDYHVTKPVEPGELESILAEASAARTT